MDNSVLKKKVESKQEIVNQLYEKEGLTDEVLDMQVEINKIRNEYDITDESEKVYEDFVQ